MPRYLQIKTLVLLVGAENDSWEEAEEHRVRAERAYASTKELMVQKFPNISAATKAQDEAGMKQLRESLDNMLEYQVDDAPRSISLRYAQYPGREGNLVDCLYKRRLLEDVKDEEEVLACDVQAEGEGEAIDENMGEETAAVKVHQSSNAGMLECSTAVGAARTQAFGEIENITPKLNEVKVENQQTPHLDDEHTVDNLI